MGPFTATGRSGVVDTICISSPSTGLRALTSLLRGEPPNGVVGGMCAGGALVLVPAALLAWIVGAQVFLFPAARVMVMNAGRIVEYDSPEELLQKQGIFSAMAKDAGITNTETTTL